MFQQVREQLMFQRTQLINAIRGHLAEFGLIGPQRAHNVGLLTAIVKDDCDERVLSMARRALRGLAAELRSVSEKFARVDEDLGRVARQVEACR